MRKRLTRVVIVLTAALSIMPLTASGAGAWTCATNDEYIPPAAGDAACQAFFTVVGPVCSKFQCG